VVTDDVVLTSATCVAGHSPKDYGPRYNPVTRVAVHPNYVPGTLCNGGAYDLALVWLSQSNQAAGQGVSASPPTAGKRAPDSLRFVTDPHWDRLMFGASDITVTALGSQTIETRALPALDNRLPVFESRDRGGPLLGAGGLYWHRELRQ